MTTIAEKTVFEYLHKARALENALTQTLIAHIAITPHGRYRNTLERHLQETKQHARKIDVRLQEAGEGRNIIGAGVDLAERLIARVLTTAKAPLDLLRGPRGEEKLLANARDEFVSEALEIAIYTALEQAARAAGDEKTTRLAASILKDEDRMSDSLRREIPTLTKAVLAARDGNSSYSLSETGAADGLRSVASGAEDLVEEAAQRAQTAAQTTSETIKKAARPGGR